MEPLFRFLARPARQASKQIDSSVQGIGFLVGDAVSGVLLTVAMVLS